jgi:hypothetical protein
MQTDFTLNIGVFIALLFGILIGGALGYLFSKSKSASQNQSVTPEAAVINNNIDALKQRSAH